MKRCGDISDVVSDLPMSSLILIVFLNEQFSSHVYVTVRWELRERINKPIARVFWEKSKHDFYTFLTRARIDYVALGVRKNFHRQRQHVSFCACSHRFAFRLRYRSKLLSLSVMRDLDKE